MKKTDARRSLKEAIDKRKSVVLTYNGEERTGDPHFLGTLINTENEAVRFYQTEGFSEKGLDKSDKRSSNNFRLLHLDKIESITLTTDVFEPHKGYDPKDGHFDLKKGYTAVKKDAKRK